MDDLSRFCCLISACHEHGKRDAGNLTVCHRYGPGRAKRMLRCRTCKARFSERKGTSHFGSHLPPEKALSVLQYIVAVSRRGSGRSAKTSVSGMAGMARGS
ncbi:hypothetical protein EP7_002037 [Isosphaeraceae bacterium EP7]